MKTVKWLALVMVCSLCSCESPQEGRPWDYRDKWEGDYVGRIVHITEANDGSSREEKCTENLLRYVVKAEDSCGIYIAERGYSIKYTVNEDGTLSDGYWEDGRLTEDSLFMTRCDRNEKYTWTRQMSMGKVCGTVPENVRQAILAGRW